MRTVLLDIGPMAHLGGKGPLAGPSAADYDLLTYPAGKGIVVNGDLIEKIGESSELRSEYGSPKDSTQDTAIHSMEGCAVVPGLVDGHNHLIWAGDRSNEITMKQRGMTYQPVSYTHLRAHETR